MIRRNIYKWHRTCSLIIAIPVLLWAGSGFLHPVMTNIRPRIATQAITPVAIDTAKIKMPLAAALKLHRIDSFNMVRLVHIDTNWFYQLKLPHRDELLYISAISGRILTYGDWLYAQYLARIFLEGGERASRPPSTRPAAALHDCCEAAADYVLNPPKGAPVKDVLLLRSYDNVYQSINRILPVYKVSFERSDGIRIYVETAQDRFAFAADSKRAAFNTLFSMLHTWQWIGFLGKWKLLVEIFFSGLAFITALMGIYIFFITKSKKANGRTRRLHRFTAIAVSLFTLMFSFSGCYHACSKLASGAALERPLYPRLDAAQANPDIGKMLSAAQAPVANIGLVKMDSEYYWQVYALSSNGNRTKDLMKSMSTAAPSVFYLHAGDYRMLENGEEQYARYLASRFSGRAQNSIRSAKLITQFNDDYTFADKLLPVWKLEYPHRERFYVETATGRLSKHSNRRSFYEGYSFAFFHKHEFLGGFGKAVKDFSTMFWALAQIIMVSIGLVLYYKWLNRKKLSKT